MERTFYLLMAVVGYLVGGLMVAADAGALATIVLGLASAMMAVWVVATGVALGMREALDERERDRPFR